MQEATLKLADILIHGTFIVQRDKWDYTVDFLCPNCSTLWRSNWYSCFGPRPTELPLACYLTRGCGRRYKLILDWRD